VTEFIDVHVHPPVEAFLEGPLAPYAPSLRSLDGSPLEPRTVDEVADYYRRRNGRAVLLGWDTESVTHTAPLSSAKIADLVVAAPDVFLGFGAVDPTKGAKAVAQVHEAARLGMQGVATHAAAQGIGPGDRFTYPVWESAADHGLVCLFHTGSTRLGAGMPGGDGVRLEPGRPIHVDTVAARFPDLRIVISHAGPMWRDEALTIAMHKGNVWLDLRGSSPQGLDERVRDLMRGPLAGRVLFGSDYPFGDVDRLRAEWDLLDMPESVTRRFYHDNAAELLGVSSGGAADEGPPP
jgi:predicted TIM-barrel fold metal-dependent hydrolase